MFEIWMESNS